MEVKGAAKLSTVIGLIAKHADCGMTFYYNQYVCDVLLFFKTGQKNQSYPQSFCICILSHHIMLVPIGLDVKEI